MSGSQHPQRPQHSPPHSNRTSANQTGPSNMNISNPHTHELQARLAYQELISPPRSVQRHPVGAPLTLTGTPGIPGHRQSHLQGQQAGHGSGASWTGHTTEQAHYQGFRGPTQPTASYHSPGARMAAHQQSPGSSHSSPHSPLSPEELSVEEDKRKRNTEASARFRMKKKERIQNMEQAMTDLQRKAEDLEKEAGDLRKENSWLKEMVIMKGKRRGTLGQDLGGGSGSKRNEDDQDSDGFDE